MTDEELKELAKLECAKLLKSEKGYNGLSYQEFWAEGVKYGRKEKWHDLRKDPNDLPKEIEIFSIPVYIVSKHGNSDLAQYDYKSKLWCYKYSNEHILYEVIAWCELPEFEE